MLKQIKNSLVFWSSPAVLSLLLVFIIGLASGLPMRGFGACVATFSIVSYFVTANYDRQLGARITQPRPFEWTVMVNGVSVGTIRDAEYAAILRHVLRDSGVAFHQLASFLKWTITVALKVMTFVPVIVFWMLALIAVALPDELMPFLHVLSAAWQARASGGALVENFVGVISMLAILSALLTTPARSRCYERAVHRLIRQHFNTPADGWVLVHRKAAR